MGGLRVYGHTVNITLSDITLSECSIIIIAMIDDYA